MRPRRGEGRKGGSGWAADRRVAVVLGSDSDLPVMEGCFETLRKFHIPFDVRILSAHRAPRACHEFAARAHETYALVIAAAGGAAHLAGTIAAATPLPVVGVPLATPPFEGQDALLATLQMPPGVPVATMAVGEWGARNAAVFAAQALGRIEEVRAYKEELARKVLEKDRAARTRGTDAAPAAVAAVPAEAPLAPRAGGEEGRDVRPADVRMGRRRNRRPS